MKAAAVVLVIFSLASGVLGANVYLAAEDFYYYNYWTSPAENPFIDFDLVGCTFTVEQDTDGFYGLEIDGAIDLSYDMVIIVTNNPTAAREANLQAYADAGGIVLFALPDYMFNWSMDLMGVNAATDVCCGDTIASAADLKTNFSSDPACAPLLSGPFGSLSGAAVDITGMDIIGVDLDALYIDTDLGNTGVECLGMSASFQASAMHPGYGNYGVGAEFLSLITYRPMANGGAIVYLPMPFTPFDILGQGFYSQVYNNLLSYAQSSGVGGDPHVQGFDHSSFLLLGNSGDVYNMITDKDLQANARLVTPEFTKALYQSFVGALGFSTAAGETLTIEAGDDVEEAFVLLNGERTDMDAFRGADMRSLSVRPVDVDRVPPLQGVDVSWHRVAQTLVVTFDHYIFEVFVIDASHGVKFLDFTISARGAARAPHGVVGRTLHSSTARDTDNVDDVEAYLVRDGLLGTDFALNKFLA